MNMILVTFAWSWTFEVASVHTAESWFFEPLIWFEKLYSGGKIVFDWGGKQILVWVISRFQKNEVLRNQDSSVHILITGKMSKVYSYWSVQQKGWLHWHMVSVIEWADETKCSPPWMGWWPIVGPHPAPFWPPVNLYQNCEFLINLYQ